MTTIQIALLQMTACSNDQAANLAKGSEFCRRARASGADLALFPEMWNIGYTSVDQKPGWPNNLWRAPSRWSDTPFDDPIPLDVCARWQAQAISQDDPFIMHFRALARELDMAIALTYLEQWLDAPRNTVSLIDRHGEIVLTYAKVHTCDFDQRESACTPGDDFYVCTLDTEKGLVNIGAMICFDREFPESARILMLKGAELIIVPNACDLETHRIDQFRTRAYENMVGVAMANYASPQYNGHSVAYDPIAFDDKGRTRDTLIIEAGEREGIYLATFDMTKIRAYREREVWGNAFRRPHRYKFLISPEVESPFIRVNPWGEKYNSAQR
jgi:N-carbamoylputrescine amidase